MNSWSVPIAAAASALVVSLPVAMPVWAAEDSRNFAKGVVVSGKPLVISGDVLEVAGRRFRLFGVDAPELGQSCVAKGRVFDCGLISTTALMDLTAGVDVTCRPLRETAAGTVLATCFAAGYDIAKGMVHTGWALAFPRSGTIYAAVEGFARKAGRGLWRGKFIAPWDWRRGKRLSGAAVGK
jgi:endonuclease YncB( thermonuclease family)